MIVTQGNQTIVDHRQWDLMLDEAIDLIHAGHNVHALPFPSFDGDLGDEYPETELIEAEHYEGMSRHRIYNHLRGQYQAFASIETILNT